MSRSPSPSPSSIPEDQHWSLVQIAFKLEKLIEKMDKQFEKMMTGFRAIDKSFKLSAGAMVAMQEDLCEALGKIESEPFDF